MVVCKFFLQGTCKFGNSCRFEHQLDDTQGTSILKQNNSQNVARSTTMDPNTLMQSVINDMMAVEHGKQWIFSSYSPFKDKPTFPGFDDKSFEEIRLGFYEANKTGTTEHYKQTVQMWYQEAFGRVKTLQNPNQEIVKLLTQIYNSNQQAPFQNNQGNNSGFVSNSILGGNPQNSIFNGNKQQNNVFAQNTIFTNTNTPPFTTNQSPFGNNTNNMQTKNFNQSINPTNSIFNQNNFNQNNPIFGNNTIFNNTQPQQIQQSPFVSQNNIQPTNNPFGNNQISQPSPFGPQKIPQNTPFNPPVSQPTPFAQPNPNLSNIFNNPPNPTQNQTIFQTNTQNPVPNNPIFNNPTPNYFQNPAPINQPPQNVFNQNPIFGNTILNKNPGGFDGIKPNVIDNSFYSKIEELTEEEIKSFENDEFEFGKIPERPPTLEMCF